MIFESLTQALILYLGTVSLLAFISTHLVVPAIASAVFGLFLFRIPQKRLLKELSLFSIAIAGYSFFSENSQNDHLLNFTLPGILAPLLWLLAPEGDVFHLNGMDRYFVCQQYPGVSVLVHYGIDLSKALDRSRLEAAVQSALEKIPLSRSFIRESFFGVQRFIAKRPFPTPILNWLTEEGLNRPMDLRREHPFRLTYLQKKTGDYRLILTTHHSMADGVGSFAFFEFLLSEYFHDSNGPVPSHQAYSFRKLLFKNGLSWCLSVFKAHVKPLDKFGTVNASLLDHDEPSPSQISHYPMPLSQEIQSGLQDVSGKRGLTRNDLLLSALIRAADRLRQEKGKPDLPFRVLLPMNLRPLLKLPENTLQNFVGVLRTVITPTRVRSNDFPAWVSESIRKNRVLSEAVETPVNLGFFSLLLPPWLFRLGLKRFDQDPNSFFFSFIFTHVKVPCFKLLFEKENNVVKDIWFKLPLTRQPGFAIAACTMGERTSLSISYLEKQVSEESVHRFKTYFDESLQDELRGE